MKTVVAIRHVQFEGLGVLEKIFSALGWPVVMVEAAGGGVAALDPLASDLLVILGGPIGAYEEHLYPFLGDELALIGQRLRAGRPTLGICLGAQLMARALGARVYPSGKKEIGWAPLILTPEGRSSMLGPLAPATPVLHWHGDTFDLPEGAVRLASTPMTPNQAFAWGGHGLGLQFHLEVSAAELEYWLVGHACEIAVPNSGVTVTGLRSATMSCAPLLENRAEKCFSAWLAQVFPGSI
jgi:GMP synthase (glutamine-hydrolysing)